MDNLPNSNLRKQVDNLANMMTLWGTVLVEIREMQQTIDKLPTSLKPTQQELDLRNAGHPQAPPFQGGAPGDLSNQSSLPAQSPKTIPPSLPTDNNTQLHPSELQDSIVHLRAVLPQLSVLEHKVGNLVALKERVEALQENLQSTPTTKPLRQPQPIQFQEVQESHPVRTPKTLAQLELQRPAMNDDLARQHNPLAKPIQMEFSQRSWRLGLTLVVVTLVGCGLSYWAIPLLDGDRFDNPNPVETRL